ncbi:energy-coupling factor ABC transporter permease [Alteromonas sp. 1_MG-2023]|uniref:energy-coupling factor ABC transporter permease n=1 Tax=Alteromonas sp. 1_MG-2023 TaxID=3062669 RepID=UPI0026E1CEDC|nr:energy-coupling factor ABC transporter permease [Alteromonas sp. 1_MG-2023]MDO6567523.1 energy-coupling factor ABC transporter permease [Alteromonas sp. 1_MG-2023]
MTTLQWLGLTLCCLTLVGVIKQISVVGLMGDKHQQHLLFGSAAALFAFWIFKVGIFEGLDVHFVGLSVVTLMLGFRYAILAGTLALLGATAAGFAQWHTLGVNGVLGVMLPVAVTYLVYLVAFHKLPRQLFVYIFVCAFFPGALTIALKTGALAGYYFMEGAYTWDVIYDNFVLLIPLLVFPEALLNGMAITLLVIYQPTWVYTFHDKFYFDN